jgi:hypothetical protein
MGQKGQAGQVKNIILKKFSVMNGWDVATKPVCLQSSSEGKFQITHRLPGEGMKRCYRFIRTEPLS